MLVDKLLGQKIVTYTLDSINIIEFTTVIFSDTNMVILFHFICNSIINKSYLPNFIYIGVESSIKPFKPKMSYGMKSLNLKNITRKMLFGSGRSNGFMFLIKILINSLTRQNYNFCVCIKYEKECIVACYPVPYIILFKFILQVHGIETHRSNDKFIHHWDIALYARDEREYFVFNKGGILFLLFFQFDILIYSLELNIYL